MSRIVIIGDNELEHQWLTRVLERPGHDVSATSDVGWALDEAARGAVDLVLVAAAAPGIDGLSILRRVKERPATTDIPVVTYHDQDALDKGVALACGLGASDAIERPFDAYDVTFRVNRALEYASLKYCWWAPSMPDTVPA